jgi:hypothetical protein
MEIDRPRVPGLRRRIYLSRQRGQAHPRTLTLPLAIQGLCLVPAAWTAERQMENSDEGERLVHWNLPIV